MQRQSGSPTNIAHLLPFLAGCLSLPSKLAEWIGDNMCSDIPKLPRSIIGNDDPLLPIIDLVIIGNNEPIITVIIGNIGTVIIGNNDVIAEVIIGNNRSNNR